MLLRPRVCVAPQHGRWISLVLPPKNITLKAKMQQNKEGRTQTGLDDAVFRVSAEHWYVLFQSYFFCNIPPPLKAFNVFQYVRNYKDPPNMSDHPNIEKTLIKLMQTDAMLRVEY